MPRQRLSSSPGRRMTTPPSAVEPAHRTGEAVRERPARSLCPAPRAPTPRPSGRPVGRKRGGNGAARSECSSRPCGRRAKSVSSAPPGQSTGGRTPRTAGNLSSKLRETRRRLLAGAGGFEPPNAGTKIRCLTTWRRPNLRAQSVLRPTLIAPRRRRNGRGWLRTGRDRTTNRLEPSAAERYDFRCWFPCPAVIGCSAYSSGRSPPHTPG